MRQKLQRWKIAVTTNHARHHHQLGALTHTPRWNADHATRNLRRLHQLVAPRVVAACWRTIWNGWHTHRRWQKRNDNTNKCMLGCPTSEDSIEHYRFCDI